MPTTAGRRDLKFETIDRVMPDVDRLIEGYTTVGKWSLGQVCNHLSGDLAGSIDGIDVKVPWLVRKLFGRLVLNRVLKTGVIPEGRKVPEAFLPKPGLDDRAEVEALRAALRMFAGHTGPIARHPFFGQLTRAQAERLHCIHCAHHLSFVVPKARG